MQSSLQTLWQGHAHLAMCELSEILLVQASLQSHHQLEFLLMLVCLHSCEGIKLSCICVTLAIPFIVVLSRCSELLLRLADTDVPTHQVSLSNVAD